MLIRILHSTEPRFKNANFYSSKSKEICGLFRVDHLKKYSMNTGFWFKYPQWTLYISIEVVEIDKPTFKALFVRRIYAETFLLTRHQISNSFMLDFCSRWQRCWDFAFGLNRMRRNTFRVPNSKWGRGFCVLWSNSSSVYMSYCCFYVLYMAWLIQLTIGTVHSPGIFRTIYTCVNLQVICNCILNNYTMDYPLWSAHTQTIPSQPVLNAFLNQSTQTQSGFVFKIIRAGRDGI